MKRKLAPFVNEKARLAGLIVVTWQFGRVTSKINDGSLECEWSVEYRIHGPELLKKNEDRETCKR